MTEQVSQAEYIGVFAGGQYRLEEPGGPAEYILSVVATDGRVLSVGVAPEDLQLLAKQIRGLFG